MTNRSVKVDHSPSQLGTRVALGSGVIAAITTLFGGVAAALGIAGLVGLFVGLQRESHRMVTLSAGGLFAGVVLAGVLGTHPIAVLVGAVGSVLAWDSADNALTLGEQLSSDAGGRRSEVVHVAATGAVVGGTAIGSYVLYRSVTGGKPLVVLVALLVGAVLLIATLSR